MNPAAAQSPSADPRRAYRPGTLDNRRGLNQFRFVRGVAIFGLFPIVTPPYEIFVCLTSYFLVRSSVTNSIRIFERGAWLLWRPDK